MVLLIENRHIIIHAVNGHIGFISGTQASQEELLGLCFLEIVIHEDVQVHRRGAYGLVQAVHNTFIFSSQLSLLGRRELDDELG